MEKVMRVLIAPDKFKGSLSANEVCDAIEKGVKQYDETIETIKHPLADGGEGTLEILKEYHNFKTINARVQNPLFKEINAEYLISDDTAFIEMSNASGLQLLDKKDQNCYNTSTFGTGQLILNAIENGATKIILFIGGSATNDGGIGMAAALGYKFYDVQGNIISPVGSELIHIHEIDDSQLKINLIKVKCTVVCDVNNLLFGKQGAAYMYGKQKGASEKEIYKLDLGLMNLSAKVQQYLFKSIENLHGGGAAGGLGAGAVSFLNAKIQSGIDFVMTQTKIENHFKNKIDLILTGEGSIDKQTLEGKVVAGISKLAHKKNTPFAVVSGVLKDRKLIDKNLKPFSINSILDFNITIEDAMTNASKHVTKISTAILSYFSP